MQRLVITIQELVLDTTTAEHETVMVRPDEHGLIERHSPRLSKAKPVERLARGSGAEELAKTALQKAGRVVGVRIVKHFADTLPAAEGQEAVAPREPKP